MNWFYELKKLKKWVQIKVLVNKWEEEETVNILIDKILVISFRF